MNSPFPGMDPFIEESGLWEDFHNHLIDKMCEQLAVQSRSPYMIRSAKRSYLVLVESEGKKTYPFLPDASITVPPGKKTARKKPETVAVQEVSDGEPIVMETLIPEEYRESFVEIYKAEGDYRLVTGLEVLSPSNKRPGTVGWDHYLRKRQSLLLEGVNLVEIDLLRGGQRMPMRTPWPDSPYTLLVARAEKPPVSRVWQGHFRTKLPRVPVPLARPDPDLTLDLQSLIDAIYQTYRYGEFIDYTRSLKPALKGDDARWFRERLREQQGKS
jgi:hypothetical protein